MSVRSNGGWCSCSIIFRMDRSAAANLKAKQRHAPFALTHVITDAVRGALVALRPHWSSAAEAERAVLYLLWRRRHSVLAQVFLHDGQVVECDRAPRLERQRLHRIQWSGRRHRLPATWEYLSH